jgi:hypothetical protein
MTVPANLNRVDYTGTGSAGPFTVPFPFYDASHLTVLQTDALFNQTTLTGWTATGAGGPSGAVTLAAACPVGSTLTIMRLVPLTQITSIKNQEAFYPEIHEKEFDLLTMADQQLDETLDRTLRLPAGLSGVDMTLPRPDPGHSLVWNAAGDGLENAGVASATLQQDLADSTDVAKGDAMIAVKQPFTGAVERTQHDKNAEWVSVKDFGAVGDGITDDTIAIGKALDALETNEGELLFPPGNYLITSSISKVFSDGKNITVRGYGAKIVATSIITGIAITLSGSRGVSTPLAATVTKGASTFSVTSATGFSKGKLCLITSTDLWNPTRAYYYKGEISLIENISGTTITNSGPLYDGYTDSTTTIHALNMPSIKIEGLEIECNYNIIALKLAYIKNPIVRDCIVHGSRYAGIYVDYTIGGEISGNLLYDLWNNSTGTSYGISIGTAQCCKVSNNTIYGTRHSVTVGGFEPTRWTIISGNTCSNSVQETVVGSIDLHGNTENSIVSGNLGSGINCSGINTIFSNNILINHSKEIPVILIYQEINSDYHIITCNRINSYGSSAKGIYISPSVENLNIGKLLISSNTVECVAYSCFIQPRTSSVTGCSINSLIIANNTFKSSSVFAFIFQNNVAATYSCGEILSNGNTYESINYDAFSCLGNTIVYSSSCNDVFKANRSNGYLATFSGTNVKLVSPNFIGNTGGAGTSRSVKYDNTGRIDVISPSFSNLTYKAEISAATEYLENGWNAVTPTILNTAGSRLVNFYGALGRAITYGTAAPSVGAWSVGDRVYSQSPSVGQPKSWVCTVAGSPGTWVSEGNL